MFGKDLQGGQANVTGGVGLNQLLRKNNDSVVVAELPAQATAFQQHAKHSQNRQLPLNGWRLTISQQFRRRADLQARLVAKRQ